MTSVSRSEGCSKIAANAAITIDPAATKRMVWRRFDKELANVSETPVQVESTAASTAEAMSQAGERRRARKSRQQIKNDHRRQS